ARSESPRAHHQDTRHESAPEGGSDESAGGDVVQQDIVGAVVHEAGARAELGPTLLGDERIEDEDLRVEAVAHHAAEPRPLLGNDLLTGELPRQRARDDRPYLKTILD